MSKVSMPRPRYVAFRVDGPRDVPRRAVADALRLAAKGWPEGAGAAPQLTRYAWPHGIVRVEHLGQAAAVRLLAGITSAGGTAVQVRTLSSSGTLKALTGRLGLLARRTE